MLPQSSCKRESVHNNMETMQRLLILLILLLGPGSCSHVPQELDLASKIDYYDKHAEDREPKFDLDCNFDDLIKTRPKLPASLRRNSTALKSLKQEIRDKVQVNWFKNGRPFWRENGNTVLNTDKFVLSLLQIGASDGGVYTCLVDFSKLPTNLTEAFEFRRGTAHSLTVVQPIAPDSKPYITHPPEKAVVHRGDNKTLTCNSPLTLTTQTTKWYKSCPFPNKTCIKEFEATVANASDQDLSLLGRFMIPGERNQELTLTNITETDTGLYACSVKNSQGFDLRIGQIILDEYFFKEQAQLGKLEESKLQPVNVINGPLIWLAAGSSLFLLLGCTSLYLSRVTIRKDKKQTCPLIPSNDKGDTQCSKDANLRQHLPIIDCPDIYNIGKASDGFISGHLHQDTGHIMSQSICSKILLGEKNPSISSSNSQQSDEAPPSWGKSMSSSGDNCRTLYSHTSNSTATTVPMYDHPPSTATFRHCKSQIHGNCVINPTYGFLRPENDVTEWIFPRRNLDVLDKIGEGQFGEVWLYKARQKDGTGHIVAVKMLKNRAGLGDRERLELIAEIEIMKSINNHPNVIKLLHYCADEYEPILLIMEYAENGKLQDYLRNCRVPRKLFSPSKFDQSPPSVTSKDLIKFTYHIARGMEYVASKGIVHRDLASRNILVSKDKVCKVADFGFARRLNDDCAYERTTANPVPVKWMAPEALVENKFTSKSDVFSLGILMWEIATLGATPYEQLSSEGVYKKVTTGGRLERPAHCRDEFYNLMERCWLHDPAQRPTFKEVAFELEKLIVSDNDYIELDQYPEHAYYNILNKEEKEIVNIVN